mmetsp:Transcript_19361/g.41705  ORF Transcript_19361/g.41705 Transcript_19361/m.41705 type:complete len:648 (-) Transcript_19361:478-2421(-)
MAMAHRSPPLANPVPEVSLLDEVNRKCRLFSEKFQGLDLQADISTLKLPTVGAVDTAGFPLSGEYFYVRRSELMNKLVAVVIEWLNAGRVPLLRNILGFRRSGKSYTLATFACALRLNNYRVLYIHNCSYWAATPLGYLRAEALSTFYGDPDKQNFILNATSIDEILQVLAVSKVIVVADQVGWLYQRINVLGQGAVPYPGSVDVLAALARLSGATLVFTAASAQKTSALVECFHQCDKQNTIHAFDGFRDEEFEIFRQRLPAYSGLGEEAIEKLWRLTGFLPGLLTLPGGADFCLSSTQKQSATQIDDGWINPIRRAVTEFVATCLTYTQEKHKASHEAAVFGTKYSGDQSLINFDIVSIPNKERMVSCPSIFCKDLLSDHLAKSDLEHKTKRLTYLRTEMEKVDQEPTKLGDAAEDYLITFMEVHKQCPVRLPGTSPMLFPQGHIPLTECKKFNGMCPNLSELTGDYEKQSKSSEPMAIGYFPSGKFLRYIDFVVRVLINRKEGEKDLMIVVVGQITLSQPADHDHTWKFFERDYIGWQGGYNASEADTRFVLTWFTPHRMPDLTAFSFENEAMDGTTINIDFGSFTGTLGKVFSDLCNPDYFKPCSCTTFCPKQCGCRKAGIPCRMNCACKNAADCKNAIAWTS